MKISRVATLVFVLAACCMITSDVFAQGRRGGGWGGAFDNAMAQLFRPDVQEELGLVDDQIEELQNLQGEMRDAMRSAFEEMRNGGGGDFQGMRERMTEMAADYSGKAKELLLDDQVKRLDEIVFQQTYNRDPMGAIQDRFDLSDGEMEKFKEAREEAQKEMAEELAKMREKYQNKALSTLPSDVQKEIKDALGKAFVGDNRGFGIWGRGGDRGQRGGDRGGDRSGDRGNSRPRSDF